MLNKVQIIGRLGQDPQTVGDNVVRLNVATTETWKDRETQERREKTEWHQVAVFGRLAGVATEYLRKGSLVYIEGTLETRKYEKDGQTHYSTSIKCREMRMLDKRGEGEDAGVGSGEGSRASSESKPHRGEPARSSGSARSNGQSNGSRPAPAQSAPAEDDDFLSDVPF